MPSSAIVVHPDFDAEWPFAADHLRALWAGQEDLRFVRLSNGDERPLAEILAEPEAVTRLVSLGVRVRPEDLAPFVALGEAVAYRATPEVVIAVEARGVTLHRHADEVYWGQSVAEFALGLTIAGLRRIPNKHRAILDGLDEWDYAPPIGQGGPGGRGIQFGDDPRFTSGTVAGKRVRVVGAGNIGSRYASFTRMLGADTAAWDPYAPDPGLHRAGTRREWHLDRLVSDAEIFAPMLPLTETARSLVARPYIEALPRGCLVVLVTRAAICDMAALRERVSADELALAADVFDIEPLPVDDPLLGRPNVVHTPHLAGRTIDANREWAARLAARFRPA
ncbi:MAG: D-3-phosphoglycerate dehydrogenase [uncultured Thermomicrobiales bacterium]|uniref:D-3-phosphoglycerate dehydrogenase n=1 Tax=uncultured Thermomicrobiales bacterium TaxID=1645740 RepID=A0A6J4U958_9BACT|nr:MAG: D-3-phosphoglycerate dehydrogenase [uncultured Thermomicrobiales bacterium]